MAESFDHVLANPPFTLQGRGTAAADAAKAAANAMAGGSLARWARFMAAMARPAGTATMIHGRGAGRLARRLRGTLRRARGLCPSTRAGTRRQSACIVQGIKGSRAPLELLPELMLHGDDNGFRPEIERMLRHGAGLEI